MHPANKALFVATSDSLAEGVHQEASSAPKESYIAELARGSESSSDSVAVRETPLFFGASDVSPRHESRVVALAELYAAAHERLVRARAAAGEEAEPDAWLAVARSLFQGHRDLSLHRMARRTGDDRSAKTYLRSARQHAMDAALMAEDDLDLCRVYRQLQNALDEELLPLANDSGEIALELDPNNIVWFRIGARAYVDLRRRRAPRLVFRALVEERMREPGSPVSMQQLIAIGWPGEKMRLEAGLSRLYVTIRSLRELGLRSVLLQQDDGYLIDPNVEIRAAARSYLRDA